MPIYEYKCSECESHIEKIQKATDEPLTTCEQCGGELKKQWSLSGFQFKGEGWYVTDYSRKQKNGGSEGKDKPAESESTAKSEPASKQETKETSGKKETSKD